MKTYVPDRPPQRTSGQPQNREADDLRGAIETLWQKIINLQSELDAIKNTYAKKSDVGKSGNAVIPGEIDHAKLRNLNSAGYAHISSAQKLALAGNNYWLSPVNKILDNRNVIFVYI